MYKVDLEFGQCHYPFNKIEIKAHTFQNVSPDLMKSQATQYTSI